MVQCGEDWRETQAAPTTEHHQGKGKTMKTYLTVASHWSTPGIRQYASTDRPAAERKAAELVDELREDWAKWASRSRDADVPPAVADGGGDWEATLRALQLSRLIDYFGGEGEANDALYDFCQRKGEGEPPLIGEGFTVQLQEIIGEFVAEDDCDPDKMGFPMVWIEEVEPAQPPAETAPADNSAIGFALRNAQGVISSLLHQVGQMQGMFSDEDGTIQEAVDAGEAAEVEIQNALEALGLGLGVGARSKRPRVAVVLSGGCLQAAIADAPAEVIIVDYDVDGADTTLNPKLEQDGGKDEPANVWIETAQVHSAWLDMVEAAKAGADEKERRYKAGDCIRCGNDLDSPSACPTEDGICGECLGGDD